MKKTIILATIAILLLVGLLYFGSSLKKNQEGLSETDNEFVVKDFNTIHKVFIADRNGKKITLTRQPTMWVINDTFKVRDDAMNILSNIFKNITIKYIPPIAAQKNIVKEMSAIGIKVELYGENDKKLKSFYVGGSTKDEEATYFISEGSEQPYAMFLPMIPGGLRTMFMTNIEDWKDLYLFREEIENIKSVAVEYPAIPYKNYIITTTGGYSIKPLNDSVPRSPYPVANSYIEKYLIQYKSIAAEAFRNTMPEKDSILQRRPFAAITLTTKENKSHTIKLFPITPDETEAKSQVQIERYFVSSSNGNFYLAQAQQVGALLWDYTSFFKKN